MTNVYRTLTVPDPMTLAFEAPQQEWLVRRCKAGDAAAMAELYEATFDHIYAYARGMFRTTQDAEDVTSETYLRALRGLRSYQSGDVPIVVWLLRIARNVAMEHLRTKLRHQSEPITTNVIEAVADPTPDETTEDLPDMLAALTPAQREVIVLRLAGFKLREIAQSLGKAEGTIKALQFAALRNLRKVAGT
jgi:RNA polymerase sigma-70 factor, ECF subfamily